MIGFTALWTEDVTIYSFIWAVFLGASAMIYSDKHFAFTSLTEHIKNPKIRIGFHILVLACMLIFMLLMLYYGIVITKKFWNYKCTNLPQLKRGPTWLCLPISGGVGCIYLIEKIANDIKGLISR